MTYDEALLAQGGSKEVLIIPLNLKGVISIVSICGTMAEVMFYKEKHGRLFEIAYHLDQLKLIDEK